MHPRPRLHAWLNELRSDEERKNRFLWRANIANWIFSHIVGFAFIWIFMRPDEKEDYIALAIVEAFILPFMIRSMMKYPQ